MVFIPWEIHFTTALLKSQGVSILMQRAHAHGNIIRRVLHFHSTLQGFFSNSFTFSKLAAAPPLNTARGEENEDVLLDL
ncbi:hypothetical protein ACS0TY_021752 [Phlomoides rotata]